MADEDRIAALTAQVAALRAALVVELAADRRDLARLNALDGYDGAEECECDRCKRLRAALALTDAQAGARLAALERLAELVDAHADCYTHAEVRAALFALAALDGAQPTPPTPR